jgi:Protein of unknown function (DUF1091)
MFLLKGAFTWSYKIYRNWRQLLQTPEVEICQFMRSDNPHPFYRGFLDEVFKVFPGLPQQCPIKPGAYYTHNSSMSETYENFQTNDKFQATTMSMPNGVFKIAGRLSTKRDPHAMYINWQYELKKRLNHGTL